MTNRIVRTICTVALGYTLALLPELCADDKSAKSTAKAPDWSKYTTVGEVVGEIVKASDSKLTLRVTWYVQPNAGNKRPSLRGGGGNYRNPYGANNNKQNLKEQHHDYDLEFVPETLVRMKTLPPKLDGNGKKIDYTQKEIDTARLPDGVPSYAASQADLVPGTIVEVRMIRDKSIPASKVGENDLRVKYAIILGKDPTPPKDIGKDDKKGKKDKK